MRNEKKSRMISRGKNAELDRMQLKNGRFDFYNTKHSTQSDAFVFSPFVSLKCSKSAFSSHFFFFHSSSVGGHRHRWMFTVVVGGWHSQRLTYSWNRNRTHSRVHAVDAAFIWWKKKEKKTRHSVRVHSKSNVVSGEFIFHLHQQWLVSVNERCWLTKWKNNFVLFQQ